VNYSHSLIRHLFYRAVESLTVRTSLNFLALLDYLLKDSASLLRIHPSLVHVDVLKAVFLRDHDTAASLINYEN
jgi:hypothetical protein